MNIETMASRGGSRILLTAAPTPKVGVLPYYFANFFAKNCIKIKESGPRGRACISGALLDPPMARFICGISIVLVLTSSYKTFSGYDCVGNCDCTENY